MTKTICFLDWSKPYIALFYQTLSSLCSLDLIGRCIFMNQSQLLQHQLNHLIKQLLTLDIS